MEVRFTRRSALIGVASLSIVPCVTAAQGPDESKGRIRDIEQRCGGRLGVAALNTATGKRLGHRADERFAMCSTFKFLAAAAVLKRVDLRLEKLDRWIPFGDSDLLEYAPVAREHVKEGGMSLSSLCAAAVELSDNTAANLLLRTMGGPQAITRFCRSLGDEVTRLDRFEPDLNDVKEGDVRDTTTPAAMLTLMNTILLGKALSEPSRRQLEAWMIGAQRGADRIPAGLPAGWRIGHKAGTWSAGSTNDIAIVWPPDRAPILVTAYYFRASGTQSERDAALREVGSVVAELS
jgi:beta-lactamase class A